MIQLCGLALAATFGPPEPVEARPVVSPSTDLGAVLVSADLVAERQPRREAHALEAAGISAHRLTRTRHWLARVAREDAATGAQRLQDPAFLAAHLEWWPWRPDAADRARFEALPDGAIRLTRYVVYQVPGRKAPDDQFRVALYAAPPDPADRDVSRQEMVAGVFLPGGARAGRATPLVWLEEATFHEAQLQGTIEVQLEDGNRQLFNVDVSNDRPWKPGVPPRDQERVWFLRQTDAVYGYGPTGDKVALRPNVAVAGDVDALGLGTLIGLRVPEGLALVVLADTGGAFEGNLAQLDWYAGVYPDRAALDQGTAHLPSAVEAGVLLLKR